MISSRCPGLRPDGAGFNDCPYCTTKIRSRARWRGVVAARGGRAARLARTAHGQEEVRCSVPETTARISPAGPIRYSETVVDLQCMLPAKSARPILAVGAILALAGQDSLGREKC